MCELTGAWREEAAIAWGRCVSDVVVEHLTELHHEEGELLAESSGSVGLCDSRQLRHLLTHCSRTWKLEPVDYACAREFFACVDRKLSFIAIFNCYFYTDVCTLEAQPIL